MAEALDTCRLPMRHTGHHQRISVSFLLLSILWLQKIICTFLCFRPSLFSFPKLGRAKKLHVPSLDFVSSWCLEVGMLGNTMCWVFEKCICSEKVNGFRG